jgi:hypothetical protein
MEDPKQFDIEWIGNFAHVAVHIIKSERIFHVEFNERRKPLNLVIATDKNDNKFWTSVPEGRQEEAEFAGKLIAAYIREYRRQQTCVITTDKKLPAPSLFD